MRRERGVRFPSEERRARALDALAQARNRGISLTRAAREVGLTGAEVRRQTGPAWLRIGRRWHPTPFDHIPREMTLLTERGAVPVTVTDSRDASLLALHANAVRTYVEDADPRPLRTLRGRSVAVGRKRHRLVTDLAVVDRLAHGGELHYELYAR